MSDTHDSRALYAALANTLTDSNQIKSAFQYWRAELEGREEDPVEIAAAVVSYLGLGTQEKKRILVTLYAAQNKPLTSLEAVPAYFEDGNNGSIAESVGSSKTTNRVYSPAVAVHQLLKDVVQNISKVSKTGIDDIAAELEESKSNNDTYFDVSKWVESGFRGHAMREDISSAEGAEIVEFFYELVTNTIGPVDADRLFNSALSALKNSPVAAHVDIDDLW